MIKFLPISFEEIPVQKTFELDGEEYDFLFQYNEIGDFITIQISKDGELVYSTNLVYGHNVFHAYVSGPQFSLVPLSESDFEKSGYGDFKVNPDDFGKKVFLFFNDETSP